MTSDEIVGAEDSLRARFEAQRAAWREQPVPDLASRRADLARLRQAVLDRRETLLAALRADFGQRSDEESLMLDLAPAVRGMRYLRRNLRRWMRPERRRVAWEFLPGRARVVRQPLGVVGILSPWNVPVGLALMPLATALAAGNRVLLKPSERSPATSAALVELLSGLFPPDQVAVVAGGPEAGAAFATLPFDHLVFTGSGAVARSIMAAASASLTPLTLELGGKSSVIVDRGVDLRTTARDVLFAKTLNAGQLCLAPDVLLLHEDDVAGFVRAWREAFRRAHPAGRADPGLTAVIDDRHLRRLRDLLDDARARGARVDPLVPDDGDVDGGDDDGEAGRAGSAGAPVHERVLTPALVHDVDGSMALAREEIFGPWLIVETYTDLEQAVARVNARPRALALYLYTRRQAVRRRVLAGTTSGNVTVNNVLLHYAQDDLPFGGVGASGMGAYHGPEGFRGLSHSKGVFIQGRGGGVRLVRPPFGHLGRRLLEWLVR